MRENFTIIDNQFMGRELGLKNPYEREVFAHIYRITTRGRGGWSGSVRELAERLAYPKSTIAKAMQELIKKNLIVKEGDTYRTVPIRDNEENAVPNPDNNVPNVDKNVPETDKTVPNTDSLPPTPPFTNNSIISPFLVQLSLNRQAGQDRKEEEPENNNPFVVNFIKKEHVQDVIDSGFDVAFVSIYDKDTKHYVKLATTLKEAKRLNLNILEVRPAPLDAKPVNTFSDIPF